MMPDTAPPIDTVALVEFVQRTARETSLINLPAAAITKGLEGREMTEFGLLSEAGPAPSPMAARQLPMPVSCAAP